MLMPVDLAGNEERKLDPKVTHRLLTPSTGNISIYWSNTEEISQFEGWHCISFIRHIYTSDVDFSQKQLERLQMFWLETEMEWCYSIDMIRRNAWGQ
jgi:hypothetical protein